jgi:hypothetical protein
MGRRPGGGTMRGRWRRRPAASTMRLLRVRGGGAACRAGRQPTIVRNGERMASVSLSVSLSISFSLSVCLTITRPLLPPAAAAVVVASGARSLCARPVAVLAVCQRSSSCPRRCMRGSPTRHTIGAATRGVAEETRWEGEGRGYGQAGTQARSECSNQSALLNGTSRTRREEGAEEEGSAAAADEGEEPRRRG